MCGLSRTDSSSFPYEYPAQLHPQVAARRYSPDPVVATCDILLESYTNICTEASKRHAAPFLVRYHLDQTDYIVGVEHAIPVHFPLESKPAVHTTSSYLFEGNGYVLTVMSTCASKSSIGKYITSPQIKLQFVTAN